MGVDMRLHQRAKFITLLGVLILASASAATADVIVYDGFSSNTGWTLGTNWQIGSTSVSPPGNNGFPDPALDNTATLDNGVLGALLGGNIGGPEGLHDFYFAVSPVYDLTNYTNVQFSYFRWLNSDYDPYMTSQLEAYDGSTWQMLYTNCCIGSDGFVTDSSWTPFAYDVSAFADGNSEFQLRFGYDVTSSGVFTISGWNVDDVQLIGDQVVPEPASVLLLGTGLAAGAIRRWRQRRS